MLSCCNDLITTFFLEEDFSSHEDFDELNPSNLARTVAIEDYKFKTNASVGRLELEALNFKTTILKRVLALTFESLNFRKLFLIELS